MTIIPVPADVEVEDWPNQPVVRLSVTMDTTPGATLDAMSAMEPSIKLAELPSFSKFQVIV